jgi:myo-inositol-1(or 4)-monophosphatase
MDDSSTADDDREAFAAVARAAATDAGAYLRERFADGAPSERHREQVRAVRGVCKRVVETWAPVVYWGLLARGRVDGYVTFHPDDRERVAGELLAGEAGCHRREDGPLSAFARDERTLAALWDALC